MKLRELTGRSFGEWDDLEVTGVANDTRHMKAGSAFVCIDGTVEDGHQYAKQALEKGAAVLITQRDTGLSPQVIVEDTRKIYAEMCANYFGRPAEHLKLIGITGTNGKTTTSYLIKEIFEACGYKTGLIGTIQNMIGEEVLSAKNTTPDPYELHSLLDLMYKAGCKVAVMEVSSMALDQKRVEGLRFAAGIFTNLTQDHLDYHGTMENYLAAKQKLFAASDVSVVNLDDSYAGEVLRAAAGKTVTYSVKDSSADFQARAPRYRPDGVDFEFLSIGMIGRVHFPIPGAFSVYNALAAGAVAVSAGLPFAQVVEALSCAKGVKGRSEVVPTGRDFTIIIDYAHTPDALRNIIGSLNRIKGEGRLVTLFGCGGDRDKTKRPLMGAQAAQGSDFVIVTSDNPRSEDPAGIISDILKGMKGTDTPYEVVSSRKEAIHYAVRHARPGDIILLAGKGHETYQVLKDGTIHLDEREIVREALEQN